MLALQINSMKQRIDAEKARGNKLKQKVELHVSLNTQDQVWSHLNINIPCSWFWCTNSFHSHFVRLCLFVAPRTLCWAVWVRRCPRCISAAWTTGSPTSALWRNSPASRIVCPYCFKTWRVSLKKA